MGKILKLGMQHWRCGPYQVCTNDDSGLTLTYFTERSNLIPNAFICEKSSSNHSGIYSVVSKNHSGQNSPWGMGSRVTVDSHLKV